jgi:Fe-S-cluster containining protein
MECFKCGECCRPIVKLSEKEIEEIKKLGHKDFYEFDEKIKSDVLKQNKGVCIFLYGKEEEFLCSIYDKRPQVCKDYPLHEGDCRPKNWEKWYPLKKLLP